MEIQLPIALTALPAWLWSLSVAVSGGGVLWLVSWFMRSRLERWAARTPAVWDDFLVRVIHQAFVPLAAFILLRTAVVPLQLSGPWMRALGVGGKILTAFVAARFSVAVLRFVLLDRWTSAHRDEALARQARGVFPILAAAVWVAALLMLLDNLGFKITTVMAGLGIGGVAVALASQAVLGDLFSYVAIMLDRPFEIGDFIILGEFMGTVEHVGIKTTRLRSLGGEQIIMSNTDLTGSRIRNFKRMDLRRVVFQVGVTYGTSQQNLRELPGVIKALVEGIPRTRFDRAHFSAFADSSLLIEVVYFVLSNDYNVYMDVQQEINLGIKREFETRGIEFAFPTRTVHMAGSPRGGSLES